MHKKGRNIISLSKKLGVGLILSVLGFASCNKLVEVTAPPTGLTSDNIYSNDATAASVLTAIYTQMSADPSTSPELSGISLITGLSGDELTLFGGASSSSTTLVQYYQNNISPGITTGPISNFWSDAYLKLYTLNIALERLPASSSLTPSVQQHLIGEAKFMRAFIYFYLVNLYGDVPLTTSSDYRINSSITRTPTADVYNQMVSDLKDAQNVLSDGYLDADAMSPTSERVRPNKWAATALLARVYLYKGNYDSAETQAAAVINNTALYDTVSLNNVFLKNSREAIWQLQPVNTGWNTEDGRIFILPPTGPSNSPSGFPVYLSPQITSAFEAGDERKTNWEDSVTKNGTTYYYPYKYKSATLNAAVTEYTMVLRLGEQYLIRAEARAHLNNVSGAQSDLNLIRTRAGLQNTTAGDQGSLLTAVQHERQTELFTEWGHRWLDLKRTNNIDNVMMNVAPEKGGGWSPNWQWYPLQAYDIFEDPNLMQNAGY